MRTTSDASGNGLAHWWPALRRLAARHVLLVDALIVALPSGSIVWAAFGEGTRRAPAGPGAWLGPLLVVAAAASLVLRRRATLTAFTVSFAATLGYLLSGAPFGPVVQLAGLAMYAVGAWTSARVAAAVCLAALAVYLPLEGAYRWAPGPWPVTLLITLGWLVLPCLLGVAVRTYREAVAATAAADRRQHAYRERLEIAKEVHDVVGHSLAVISMQAGVALRVLDRQPQRPPDVAAALLAIRTASNTALGELRTALAAFPARQDAERAPHPGLGRLPALVEAVNGPVLRVRLEVSGERGTVRAPVDLAAYRIVQEALTNVVRHAHARNAFVRVDYRPDQIGLFVADDGRGTDAMETGLRHGRGLIGMRERAGALGGTLRTGPGPGGTGFQIAAVLPRDGARS